MIEESILKSNFIGRDGFKWWIGQIGPESCQGDQINERGNAWGNRIRVRIMGYHPQNPIELPDNQLLLEKKLTDICTERESILHR